MPEWGRYSKADADADIAVHAALATGVHGVGTGTIVGTALTQTLTSKTLTSPAINGTVTTTGLTMPAFTGDGNISLGGNKLTFTDGLLKTGSSYGVAFRDAADQDYGALAASVLYTSYGLVPLVDGVIVQAHNADGEALLFKARDTGVAAVTVGRLVGAPDPYMEATLGLVLGVIAQPATPVEGWLIYNASSNKLQFWNGSAWETVTSGVV